MCDRKWWNTSRFIQHNKQLGYRSPTRVYTFYIEEKSKAQWSDKRQMVLRMMNEMKEESIQSNDKFLNFFSDFFKCFLVILHIFMIFSIINATSLLLSQCAVYLPTTQKMVQ